MTGSRVTALAAAALAVAALLLAAAGCGKDSAEDAGAERPPVPVTLARIGRATLTRRVALSGQVRPESRVQLVSRASGRLEALSAEVCDQVRKGQVLARLDQELPAAQLRQAEAGRAVAAADLKVAEVALADARRDRERAETLFKSGAIDEQSRDKARAALETAEARRELAASRLAQAHAAETAARVNLDETEIRATIDGTVTRRFLDRGDFAAPGQPLFELQDLRTLKVAAAVTQADALLLVPGATRARLTVEGVGEVFDAAVSKVEPTLNPATMSIGIELGVGNLPRPGPAAGGAGAAARRAPPWLLLAGMNARIELDLETHPDAPAVPAEALRSDGRGDFIFVPDAARRTVRRLEVTRGISSGDLVELVRPAGLAGQWVVVGGAGRVTDGARVQARVAAEAAGESAPAAEGDAAP